MLFKIFQWVLFESINADFGVYLNYVVSETAVQMYKCDSMIVSVCLNNIFISHKIVFMLLLFQECFYTVVLSNNISIYGRIFM